MDLQLAGKQALVTGSTSGIGYAIARALLKEGADVIVNGRSQETVDAAIASLREETGKTAKGFAADMATAEGTNAIHAAFPNVEILVNNVGGYGPAPFETTPDAEWYRLFDLNVMSGVRLSRLYLPRMREANWGRIIFISSESAYHIPPESIDYGMTKAAQIAVARGLAEATATTGITVNTVVPGPTKTRGAESFLKRQVEAGRRSEGRRAAVLRHVPADVADQAVRGDRRGRQLRRVHREPARVGDDGRGAARRRRHGQERVLSDRSRIGRDRARDRVRFGDRVAAVVGDLVEALVRGGAARPGAREIALVVGRHDLVERVFLRGARASRPCPSKALPISGSPSLRATAAASL